jgi:hypothetical protein
LAAEVSIDVILAWASVDRTTAMYSIPVRVRSST